MTAEEFFQAIGALSGLLLLVLLPTAKRMGARSNAPGGQAN